MVSLDCQTFRGGKQPIIALLPPFDCYEEICVKADIFALRLCSQISDELKDKHDFVLFDGYIDKHLAQKYNEKGVFESLKHSTGTEGDCSKYKGLSLVDIDHAAIYTSVFVHCYREALAFLSLVNQFKPSKVIINFDDPNRDIFDELAKEMALETDIVRSFGKVDNEKRKLIKESNRALDIQEYDWYRLLKQPVWKYIIVVVLNCWSKLIRKIKGKKPFVYIIHHGQLSGIRAQLCAQKEYYAIFFKLAKLPFVNMLTSGFSVLQKQYMHEGNNGVLEILKNYKKHLNALKNNKIIGQVEFGKNKYSITNSIASRLYKNASYSFSQIAHNIDVFESFICKNKVAGALVSSDLNWDRRIVIRVFQKHRLKNMVLINGWFGTKHTIENKSIDKVLCFGNSYIENYFAGKEDVKISGSPTFDAAYKKKNLIKPKYPIRRILISTFTFSPADINCRYSDTERYLNDILAVIKKYEDKNNYRMQVAIRPHPSDSPDFYRWYLKRSGFPEIEVKTTGSFQEAVCGYDLFFASYSTTVFETAAMGIPVIFYHPCNQILYPPFDGSCEELPSAFALKDLERVFNRIMEDKDYAYKFTDVKVLNPYVGTLDGKSTSRIINEVIKMTEGS